MEIYPTILVRNENLVEYKCIRILIRIQNFDSTWGMYMKQNPKRLAISRKVNKRKTNRKIKNKLPQKENLVQIISTCKIFHVKFQIKDIFEMFVWALMNLVGILMIRTDMLISVLKELQPTNDISFDLKYYVSRL